MPEDTEWMDLSKNQLRTLFHVPSYVRNLQLLNFSGNKLESLSRNVVDVLSQSNLEHLDLSNNHFSGLPTNVKNFTNHTALYLSGNNFTCDCEMLWMFEWMNTSNVQDYKFVRCSDGQYFHTLDKVKLGCYPRKLELWQKILVGILTVVTCFAVVGIVSIKRWNEVKWLLYLHFDILDKNDGVEHLTNKESDALLSYR